MRVVREKRACLAMTARAAAKAPVPSALASMKALVLLRFASSFCTDQKCATVTTRTTTPVVVISTTSGTTSGRLDSDDLSLATLNS